MTWLDLSSNGLAAYPRGFVLACIVVAVLGVGWLALKILKWSLCLVLATVGFVGVALLVAVWLG